MRLPGRKRLEVKAARPTTEQPKPRVLVVGIDDDDFVERLSERVPTVRVPRYLSDVDLHEWDCVITRSPWTSSEFTPASEASYGQDAIPENWTWTQHLPPHVSVLYAVRPSEYRRRDIDLIDFWPSSGEGVEPPGVVVVTQYEVQGQHVAMAEGLPAHLTELVRRHLLPIAERRDEHTTS